MASLLDVLVEPGLRSRASITRRNDGALIDVEGIEKTIRFSCPNHEEDLARFTFWSVRPASSAESAIREIKSSSDDGRTLGYVFPITSFSPSSEYCAAKLSGRFRRIFAGAAALALTELGVGNACVSADFGSLPEEVELSGLYDSDLAIVVVGRSNLARSSLSEDEVKLLLQERGYFVADLPSEYSWSRPLPFSVGGAFGVGRVSPDVRDVIGLISQLISLASTQSSAVASLLIYYQVIEVLSEKLLNSRLQRLTIAPPAGAWELKEALREAVSESSRVKALCSQASVGDDAATLTDLRRVGVEVLNSAGIPTKEDVSAADVLYAVRNLVVHNQKMLTAASHSALGGFVYLLHSAAFGMVRRLDLRV